MSSGGELTLSPSSGGAEGPDWMCHPNTKPRSREDTTPACNWISSCDGVECSYGSVKEVIYGPPELDCQPGYEVGLAAGACCYDCVRSQPIDPPLCVEACPKDPPTCAPGYRAAATLSTCCPECAADQDYCNTDADCILATRPANCCVCVQAVSVRRLEADVCFTGVAGSRATPDACEPDWNCEIVDCACPPQAPTSVSCVAHHCTAL